MYTSDYINRISSFAGEAPISPGVSSMKTFFTVTSLLIVFRLAKGMIKIV